MGAAVSRWPHTRLSFSYSPLSESCLPAQSGAETMALAVVTVTVPLAARADQRLLVSAAATILNPQRALGSASTDSAKTFLVELTRDRAWPRAIPAKTSTSASATCVSKMEQASSSPSATQSVKDLYHRHHHRLHHRLHNLLLSAKTPTTLLYATKSRHAHQVATLETRCALWSPNYSNANATNRSL